MDDLLVSSFLVRISLDPFNLWPILPLSRPKTKTPMKRRNSQLDTKPEAEVEVAPPGGSYFTMEKYDHSEQYFYEEEGMLRPVGEDLLTTGESVAGNDAYVELADRLVLVDSRTFYASDDESFDAWDEPERLNVEAIFLFANTVELRFESQCTEDNTFVFEFAVKTDFAHIMDDSDLILWGFLSVVASNILKMAGITRFKNVNGEDCDVKTTPRAIDHF